MKCRKMKEQISRFLDNELLPSEQLPVLEHLKLCTNCRKELDALSQVSDFLNLIKPIAVPPEFSTNLQKRIAETENSKVSEYPLVNWAKRLVVPAGIAALFVIAVFGGDYLGQRLSQRIEKTVNLTEEVANVTGSTSFEDFPEGSLVDAYTGLLTEGGK